MNQVKVQPEDEIIEPGPSSRLLRRQQMDISAVSAPNDFSDLPTDYPNGSILKIMYKNFLTYENSPFYPGENLNLLLGFNGSGKSSVICGICLALGGNPKLLGRSEKVTDYIRHGCNEGSVEVILADSNLGPQSLKVVFRHQKSPEHRLNGNPSSQSEIKKLCQMYNIQIDNPCAFLAQDKVKSFSEQSPEQLLLNTERAASEELLNQHFKLMEERNDEADVEKRFKNSEQLISQLKRLGEISALEPRLENYRRKLAMQENLRLLEKKSAIMEFQDADIKYKEKVKACDEAREALSHKEVLLRKTENEVKKHQDVHEEVKKDMNKIKQDIRNLVKEFDSEDPDVVKRKLSDASMNFTEQERRLENFVQKEKKLRDDLELWKKKLEQTKDECKGHKDFVTKERAERMQIFERDTDLSNLEDDIDNKRREIKNFQSKIRNDEQRASDLEREKVNILHQTSNGAGRAWLHYLENRAKFREPVFIPLLQIQLKDAEMAKYVEQAVGRRDLCMFICGCKEDEMNLAEMCKDFGINTTVVRPQDYLNNYETEMHQELKDIGFIEFLSEMISAPPAIRTYLYSVSYIHKVPIGRAGVDSNMIEVMEVLKTHNLSRFFTPNMQMTVIYSKYSGESIQQSATIGKAKYMHANCFLKTSDMSAQKEQNMEQLKNMNDEVEEQQKKHAEQRKANQERKDAFVKEQVIWREKVSKMKALTRAVENEEEKVARHCDSKPDIEAARRNLEEEKRRIAQDEEARVRSSIENYNKYMTLHKNLFFASILERDSLHQHELVKTRIRTLKEELQETRDIKVAAVEGLSIAHAEIKLRMEHLQSRCGLRSLDKAKFNDDERKIFDLLQLEFEENKLPNELDELRLLIQNEKSKLNIVVGNDDGSQRDEEKMNSLKKQVQTEMEAQAKLKDSKVVAERVLGEAIDKWRVPVEQMMSEINENYRKFFERLGCIGEVHLDVPENKLDIKMYGVKIMVSFRKGEQMRRLDQKVQSGGERSVSTMLYLLALQQLCPVPFRCVDEINQGMDPRNERKVFEIIVETLSSGGELSKTQYFLLTPKLLHDLKFNNKVTCHIVHNVVPKDIADYDVRKKLKAMKA